MTDRFHCALDARAADAVPFVPAVYEHKAWFIGRTPSEISRDEELLVEATLAEVETLRPDAVVVGVDVYNVEAEAAGCAVTYYEEGNTSVPSATPGGEAIREGEPPSAVRIPDPARDGRMPLMISAAARVAERLRGRVPVMGALTGPFSLAAALCGPSTLLMAMATDPDWAHAMIGAGARISEGFGRAFARRGLAVTVFDSQASPALIAPSRFAGFVREPTRRLISTLASAGMRHVPYVIGGNTDAIIGDYLATGGNYILCDGPASAGAFLDACRAARRAFRRNIPSDFIATATVEEIRERAAAEVARAEAYPGFILGTGVIAYGTPTERILAVREACTMNTGTTASRL